MTSRVRLAHPRKNDASSFRAAALRSRELHRGWAKAPATDREFTAMIEADGASGNKRYLVWTTDDAELVGMINVSGIIYGGFKSAYLGYYAFSPHDGTGLFSEGFRKVLGLSFGEIGLHRVEANIQPENVRSIALVEKFGFRKEGYSPRYLKIGGRWRDHVRFALLSEDWRKSCRNSGGRVV